LIKASYIGLDGFDGYLDNDAAAATGKKCKTNHYTGFANAVWGGKTMGGQHLLIVSTVASGKSFSRPPSRRWIDLVMTAIWTMKKTTVVAHSALVL